MLELMATLPVTLAASSGSNAQASDSEKPLYRDALAPVDGRVADLLSRMTLEEKVAQT